MPVLIITPLITAETCEGAAGWASGSQTCMGMKPALVPKPTRARRKRTPPAPPRRREPLEIQRPGIPAQQQEHRQQKGRAQVHGHEVSPAGPADALFFVFQRHQEERRQRHEFPAHEKQHAVARHDDQQHAGGEQIEEEPGETPRFFRAGSGQVSCEIFAPVDGRQHGHQRDRRREDRRKRVDFHVGRTQRQRPRQPQRLRPAGNEHAKRRQQGRCRRPAKRWPRRSGTRRFADSGRRPAASEAPGQ